MILCKWGVECKYERANGCSFAEVSASIGLEPEVACSLAISESACP
jgi:hypothetical protein